MSYTPTSTETRAHVEIQVAIGSASRDDIVEQTADGFHVDPEAVEVIVDEAMRKREREQASWPSRTDCDRLDEVFIDLERGGIVARQDFTCCNTCGHYEIHDAMHDARERGRKVDGYVFYHRQDTEHAVTGGVLHLRYSPNAGARVVEALRAHGFDPEWDGDAARTIEIAIDWKRRAWRKYAPAPATPQSLLARWGDELARTSAADFAVALGLAYARALIETDRIAEAFAWARAPLVKTGDLSRSIALALLAQELSEKLPPEQLDAVWIEAFEHVPYGWYGTLVDLLLRADLARPAVRDAARERTMKARDDVFGAAAVAWFHARSGEPVEDHVLERLQAVVDRPQGSYGLREEARVALAAAMWVLHARRGEPVEAVRAIATESRESHGVGGPFVQNAIALAKAELGEAAPAGRAEPSTLEEAERTLAQIAEGFPEGLYTESELHEARLDVVRLRARSGDEARALRELSEIASEARSAVLTVGTDIRAWLESVSSDAASPPPKAEVKESALEKAMVRWTAAKDRQGRLRARHAGNAILRAAVAAAKTDRDRAVQLAAVVLDQEDSLFYLDDEALCDALVVIGRLDSALERAADGACGAVGPVARELALRGRVPEATGLLDKAFERSTHRSDAIAMAPAIIAIAEDRRAAAHAMLEAWSRAEAGLGALVP